MGLGVALATLFLWRALDVRDRAQIERTIDAEAAGVTNEITALKESRILALVRMAQRWEVFGLPSRDQWEYEAELHVNHYPGTQALLLVDAALRVQWVAPVQGNEGLQGRNLGADRHRREVLAASREHRVARLLRAGDLGQKEEMLAAVPVVRDDKSGGFIVAVYRAQQMLESILENVALGYGIAVFAEDTEIYRRPDVPDRLERVWAAEREVELSGLTWRVRVWPRPKWLAQLQSRLDKLALVGGLSLAVLLGLALRFTQSARLHARQVEAAKSKLEAEVAERRRAQAAEAHLAAIVDSTDDAIVGTTLDGVVASWNSGAERVYGHSAMEMRGRPVSALLPDGAVDELRPIIDRLRHGEPGEQLETVHATSDGRRIHVALTVSPIRDADGGVAGASVIARDVSRRREAQAKLESTLAQLERASREQTHSIASVSHDVRGALAAIAGYAEVLSHEVAAGGLNEMAQRIVGLAHTLAEVMTDLLQYAREQRRTDVRWTAVCARELIAACAEDFHVPCMKRGLALRVALPVEGTMVTDPTMVRRILQNLLSNAVRYTPRGEIVINSELSAAALRLCVQDTGIGIAPEDMDKIFDEFYRSAEARRMEDLGTGLGLATVRRLAWLLGGSVRVESTPGVGSSFEVVLPREAAAAAEASGAR